MPGTGIEPVRGKPPQDFKSCVSANSTTPASRGIESLACLTRPAPSGAWDRKALSGTHSVGAQLVATSQCRHGSAVALRDPCQSLSRFHTVDDVAGLGRRA